VDHIAHIGLVDAHSECVGRNYDTDLVIYKSFLALEAFIAVQARMVTHGAYAAPADLISHRFNFLTRRTVDDAGDIGKFFKIVKEIRRLVGRMLHLKKEVFPVKTGHNRKWGSKLKLADDVFPDFRRGSSGKRGNNGALPQRGYSRCYVEIGRAEVMSPLGDTVCFVNYYQGNIQ